MAKRQYTPRNGGSVTNVTHREKTGQQGRFRPGRKYPPFGHECPKLELFDNLTFDVRSDPDAWSPDLGKVPSRARQRAESVVKAALQIIAGDDGHAPKEVLWSTWRKLVDHIKRLRLPPYRLNNLRNYLGNWSKPDATSRADTAIWSGFGMEVRDVRQSAYVAYLACASLLARAPLQSFEDALALTRIVAGAILPEEERGPVADRLCRHIANAVHNRPFEREAAQ